MDTKTQIDEYFDEARAVLTDVLSQKKTGARIGQTATKTPDRALRRVPLMKASDKGGTTVSMGELKQLWGTAFRSKMMHDAMQRLSPKDRRNLATDEQIHAMINSKGFKEMINPKEFK